MKKLLIVIMLCYSQIAFFQNKPFFSTKVILRNYQEEKISSTTFNNFGKPFVIEFFGTHCKPCIKLLDSLKEVYSHWKNKYGVKIIVIVTDPKSKMKKAKKMIEKHQWPFEFYFDTQKNLYSKLKKGNSLPQTLVYNGNFEKVGHFIKIDPNYVFCFDSKTKKFKKKLREEKKNTKYNHLDMDLSKYEESIKSTLN